VKVVRFAVVLAGLVSAWPVGAGEMGTDEARRFIAGKLYSFRCFEGTAGAGRIHHDGSVVGVIRFSGTGPIRYVNLPAGTLRVKGAAWCASLKGISFEPCFSLDKTDEYSFRGSVAPFILRGVCLLGIDSVMCPLETRREAWKRLASDLDRGKLAAMTTEVGLGQAPDFGAAIIEGRVRGRIVVKIG